MVINCLYKLASSQLRPMTYASELTYEIFLPSNKISNWEILAEKVQKIIVLTLISLPALFLGFLSVSIRIFAKLFNSNPFLYDTPSEIPSPSQLKELTVLFWNVCNIAGGFPYGKGGVWPWRYRIERVADEVIKLNADVICLSEMHDNGASWKLIELLKAGGYKYFYYNIGAPFFGANSGLFLASKLEIKNPQFFPLKDKMKRIDSFFTNKGYFSFEVYSANKKLVNLLTTHTQHSSNDMNPSEKEKNVRNNQMMQIVGTLNEKNERAVLVGDLNVTPKEYESSSYKKYFYNPLLEKNMKGQSFNQSRFKKATCFKAELMGNLWENEIVKQKNVIVDHALLFKSDNPTDDISTDIVDGESIFSVDCNDNLHPEIALSDHLPLLTTLKI
jgi:exonuclease III